MSDNTLRAGDELAGPAYLLDDAAAQAYSAGVQEASPRKRKNIHSDSEAAARAGFSRPIAAGEQTIALVMELVVARFGERFYHGGSFEVSLVRPVFYGDTVTARARVERIQDRFAELSIRVENQDAEAVLMGVARAPVDS